MLIAIWTQTAVLLATLIVVCKYTGETARLRREAARQTNLQLRPIVVPKFVNLPPPGSFHVENIGHGCAMNVQVMPIGADSLVLPESGVDIFEARFDRIEYLRSGEIKEVEGRFYSDERPIQLGPSECWFFHPRVRSNEDYTIQIAFEDVEGGKYRVQAVISAEPNPVNLPRRLRIGPVEQLS